MGELVTFAWMSRYRRPLVELREVLNSPWQRAIYRLTGPWLEKILGIEKLNRYYEICENTTTSPGEFARRVLEVIGMQYALPKDHLQTLRSYQGPLIVVCNHPFGGIEAIFLVLFLSEIRSDFRIIANYFLERIDEVKDALLFVNPFGGDAAQQFNLRPLRQAVSYLREGGLLGIFPAGEVASFSLREGRIREPAWNPFVGWLALQTQSAVLPLYFYGSNSLLFHAAGLVNPALRTGLLIREFIQPSVRKVHYLIGTLIPPQRLADLKTPEAVTDYLRARTYLLGEKLHNRWKKLRLQRLRGARPPRQLAPVVNPVPSESITSALKNLPQNHLLLTQGEWAVYVFRGAQQPLLLQELGRLREITFRAVGEGSGKPSDIDPYDEWYDHLLLYHTQNQEIAGAYRIGRCDEILATRGPRGLYTYSLFHISRKLLKEFSPALELGRAFVAEKYQKSYAPLYLLWRGIGTYLLRYPQYRYLIGPVSISAEFPDLSKALLISFLEEKFSWQNLRQQVQPRTPYEIPDRYRSYYYSISVNSLQDVQTLIEEIEGSHIKIPILIKHYLKMGARLIALNIDRDFGNALDILMMTDLLKANPEQLRKYMTPEGYEQYLRFHGFSPESLQSEPRAT